MIPLLVAAAVVLAVALNAGVVASFWVQRSAKVTIPDGRKVRVRLTPTGVHWVTWTNWDLSSLGATYSWIRYVRGDRRTWSITVTPAWGDTSVIAEFATRSAALTEFPGLAEQVASGQVVVL